MAVYRVGRLTNITLCSAYSYGKTMNSRFYHFYANCILNSGPTVAVGPTTEAS